MNRVVSKLDEIDTSNAEEFWAELEPAVRAAGRDGGVLYVDLGAVSFMSSAGLGVLIRAKKALGDHGVIRLENAGGHMTLLLEATGLEEFLGAEQDSVTTPADTDEPAPPP